jgi:dipeptidyl aminopeptidase/acylaminoacyl peptidase
MRHGPGHDRRKDLQRTAIMKGAAMTTMEQVVLPANGLPLTGALYTPGGQSSPRPAAVLCHGFAGQTAPALASMLADAGIVALTFKFRGYNGQPTSPITVDPFQQAEEARLAVDFLSDLAIVDQRRVAIVGSSLGGSVAIIATAMDRRIAACVAMCPVVTGTDWLKNLSTSEEHWNKTLSIAKDTSIGASSISRFDLVPIPEDMRHYLPPDTPMHFTSRTIRELMKINLIDHVSALVDTPVLLLHAEDDRVVGKTQSDHLAQMMGSRVEYHQAPSGDHFISANVDVQRRITGWLSAQLSVESEGDGNV